MADSHVQDPNAAPMHHEIQERFAAVHLALAAAVGVVAAVAGIVLGIFLAND